VNADTGARLGDRYRLDARIATGGMGEVWRARDELLDRDVAVKLLKREYADDAGFVERFRGEARHTAGLAHPGIAGVFDYGEAGGTSYLVMELVPGEPLSAVLARDGRLSPDRTLDVVTQAARALDAAHQGGVIHRDIKPGNILVCPDGTVKLTDFGIARAADAVPLTQTGMVLGTAHYLSPEQGNGKPVTPASDVYSLGVVAYECLAGARPFEGNTPVGIAMAHMYEDPPALPPDVPEPVADLVAQALAKEPDDRFASAAAFAKAAEVTRARLTGTDAAETVALPAVGATSAASAASAATAALPVQPRLRASRRPSRALLLVSLAVALLLVIAALAWGASRPPPERTVPALVGKTERAAYQALDALKLEHTEKADYSARYPAGTVMAQDPKAGTTLREGDNVSVTISRGRQPVSLPQGLTGRPVDEVAPELERRGLKVERVAQVAVAPSGTVIAVTPTSGLHRGDTVRVTYAVLPVVRGDDKDDKEDKDRGKDEKDGD
jgi:serine/threonine-protein kinase